MIDRLKYVLAQMDKMNESGWIRYEGNQAFQEGRAELVDTIATYVPPATVAPQVVYQVMTAEQVEALVDGVIARMPPATDVAGIVTAIAAEIQTSDVAVIDAITQSQGEVIAALTPAPAPEPAA